MESYVRIGGRGLKNLTYSYMGVGGGVKNCLNHPYVINEWPLSTRVTSCLLHGPFLNGLLGPELLLLCFVHFLDSALGLLIGLIYKDVTVMPFSQLQESSLTVWLPWRL